MQMAIFFQKYIQSGVRFSKTLFSQNALRPSIEIFFSKTHLKAVSINTCYNINCNFFYDLHDPIKLKPWDQVSYIQRFWVAFLANMHSQKRKTRKKIFLIRPPSFYKTLLGQIPQNFPKTLKFPWTIFS